jgi:hypothetical protein
MLSNFIYVAKNIYLPVHKNMVICVFRWHKTLYVSNNCSNLNVTLIFVNSEIIFFYLEIRSLVITVFIDPCYWTLL